MTRLQAAQQPAAPGAWPQNAAAADGRAAVEPQGLAHAACGSIDSATGPLCTNPECCYQSGVQNVAKGLIPTHFCGLDS